MDTTTSGNLTDRIATLSPAKRALLELKLKRQGVAHSEENTIPHRATQGVPPLSFAQQRLWFLDQLDPESAVYNLPGALRLRGPLNVTALAQSLNEIVRRHEVLRTTFAMREGEPVQLIASSLPLPLPIIDLSERAESEREAEAERLVREEALQPFDLRRGPLVRAKVLRLGEHEHILVLTLHHIVSDGWSTSVLYRELAALYQAFAHGQPSPLPELSLQYADYATWQRQWLQGEVLDRQLSYWKHQLENIPALLNLPTDRPRPAVQTFHGAHQSLTLPQTLVDALKEVSRREQATLYMTMMAALQALLYRYTGQETIVVGSPIAGRRYKETEELIGFFVNTLALKTDLSGNPGFTELLARVRRVTLEAYDHQDVPFEKLVAELHSERNLSHSPLFQVVLAFQNVPSRTIELPGLTLTPVEVGGENAKFDLTLFLVEREGALRATMEYNTDLFDQGTVARMLGHYQRVLQGVVEQPNRRLSELPLLTEAEHYQLVVEWNDTKRDYSQDQCVHQLFEAQVEKSPDAVAIVCGEQSLTYRDLNRRANQLAHSLRKLGVGPDVPVALCMERSLEMIVALLGILKAGGAYVPLDPDYPQERLQFMLDDTQALIVLTQQGLVDRLPRHGVKLFCLDRDEKTIRQESTDNLAVHTTAEHLAYVIYTSGSTGRPKGVEVPHRGIVRLLSGSEYVHFTATEVFLQLAPMSFDAATFELWGALLHGAKCVLFPGRLPAATELGAVLHRHQVSTLWLTASLFNNLIDHAPQVLAGVRQLITGGEALSVAHMRRALTLLPDTQLINGYGPTESTTFACTYPLPRHLEDTISSIAIGRPIANTEVYILDTGLCPVPVGIAGELYIGGAGLARGYVNRPELTAEQFIPHPFSTGPGARLYKTGDLARYLPDGNIEFLGRRDDQVKIRGFRIELGEIENVLSQHQAVRQVAVIVREDNPGDKRLVAYVVSHECEILSPQTLKMYLQQKLPEYMTPAVFVLLDALPVSPNGKVDRRALPQPEPSRAESAPDFVAPRTPLEELLAGVWADALTVDKVSVHDNFFDLGGHSLLAIRVVWALEKRLGRTVQVASIFQAPTIGQLATLLSAQQPASRDTVEARLTKLWEAEFGTSPLSPASNFFALGGDWVRALYLLRNVEKEFGKKLALVTLFEEPTIGQMAHKLRRQDENVQTSFVLPFRTTGSRRPFFCVSVPRELVHYLGPDQPVYGFPPYGYDGRGGPETVEEIATQYLSEIRAIQAQGPYWLGGFSFGGMVAFEIAQQLRRQGQSVAGLFLFEPTSPHEKTAPPSVRHISSFAPPTPRSMRSLVPRYVTQLRQFPPREQLTRLWNGMNRRLEKKFKPVKKALKLIVCQGYLRAGYLIPPALREFYGRNSRYPIIRRYRPKPYVGRVILFKSTERVDPARADWEHFLTGETQICYIPGKHEDIFKAPYFQTWVPQMVDAFQQVASGINPNPQQ